MQRNNVIDIMHIEKIKRILLIVIGVMLVLMVYYIMKYNPGDRVDPVIEDVTDADVIVHDVNLVEYVNDRVLWKLNAAEASVYAEKKETRLENIAIDFFDETGTKSMHLVSDHGKKDDQQGDILATGNVRAEALIEGMTLTTEELTYTAETEKITSNRLVRITKDNISTEGERLVSDLHLAQVRIIQNVRTILQTTPQQAVPVIIVAETLQLDNFASIATYIGNVEVNQGNAHLQADQMRVYITKDQEAEESISRIELQGNVRVVQDDLLGVGEEGEYTSKDQLAVLRGTPEKQAYGEDSARKQRLEADVIKVFLATGDIKGEGNVKTTGILGLPPSLSQ